MGRQRKQNKSRTALVPLSLPSQIQQGVASAAHSANLGPRLCEICLLAAGRELAQPRAHPPHIFCNRPQQFKSGVLCNLTYLRCQRHYTLSMNSPLRCPFIITIPAPSRPPPHIPRWRVAAPSASIVLFSPTAAAARRCVSRLTHFRVAQQLYHPFDRQTDRSTDDEETRQARRAGGRAGGPRGLTDAE